MTTSPIRSQAQHDMLTKAAADAAYAAQRGISQAEAQQMLDAHKQAGSPKLPARAPTSPPPASVRRGLGEKGVTRGPAAWWK